MIEIIVGWIIVVIGSLLVGSQVKGESLSASRTIAAIGVLIVVFGALLALSLTGPESGLPKTNLPQENTPFFVKSIRTEGSNDVYMEIVPYNDINASEQPRYKIPAEKFKELAEITAGTVIINDGGTIKPFPAPKV